MGSVSLSLLVAAFIFAFDNAKFLSGTFEVLTGQPLAKVVFSAIGFDVVLFSVSLLAPPYLQKPYLALVLLAAAAASYYQDSLGVRIDREMIQNTFNTTANEAGHFITLGLVGKMLFCGILPSIFVHWVKLRPVPLWRRFAAWIDTWLGAALLLVALVATDFKAYYAIIRGHNELEASLQPSATIGAVFKFGQMMFATANIVAAPLGRDAKAGTLMAKAEKPVLLVLVVGESARAANFGLGGYARNTTPELAKQNAAFFDTISCGTSTAVSVPCMLSHLPQAESSFEAGRSHENLLDVLQHAGFDVQWLENNTGDYDLAARTKYTVLAGSKDTEACAKEECNDSIFLKPLQNIIDTATKNTVVVLHQVGSHGPPYYLRYPDGFEPFAPAC